MTTSDSKLPTSPRLKVTVTDEIIETSKRRSSSHCMTAEAVRAAYPDASRVSVDMQTIRFTNPKRGLRFVYLTPPKVQHAIILFDKGETPMAFDFRLANGHVVLAGKKASRYHPVNNPISDAAREQRVAAGEASRKAGEPVMLKSGKPAVVLSEKDRQEIELLRRPSLAQGIGPYEQGQNLRRVGGRPAPTAIGKVRSYGIKSLVR